jgi:hypothetical protein
MITFWGPFWISAGFWIFILGNISFIFEPKYIKVKKKIEQKSNRKKLESQKMNSKLILHFDPSAILKTKKFS